MLVNALFRTSRRDPGNRRKGAIRGSSSSRPHARGPKRFDGDNDGEADRNGFNSRSSSSGPSRRPYNSARSRTLAPPLHPPRPPPLQRAPRPLLASQSGEPQDPFANLGSWIKAQHADGVVVRRETWEKLLGHIHTSAQAAQALELMLQDAQVRDAAGWDWATHGYGQTVFQMVQVAAEIGAPELAVQLLQRRENLHLTLNKALVPSLIRKVAGATATWETAGGDLDAYLDVVQDLYEQEVKLRGANSPEAAYELSKVLRRANDVRGIQALHEQIRKEDMEVRERLMEDLERWLAQRRVRV